MTFSVRFSRTSLSLSKFQVVYFDTNSPAHSQTKACDPQNYLVVAKCIQNSSVQLKSLQVLNQIEFVFFLPQKTLYMSSEFGF